MWNDENNDPRLLFTLMAWNCKSRRAVLVEGEPGRTVPGVPAGTSSGTKRLGFEANTSRRGLASLCFKKLWKRRFIKLANHSTIQMDSKVNKCLWAKHPKWFTINMRLHCGSFSVASIMNSSTVWEGWRVRNLISGSRKGLPALMDTQKSPSLLSNWTKQSLNVYWIFMYFYCTSISMARSVFITTSNRGLTSVWGAAGIRWKRFMMAEQIFISYTRKGKKKHHSVNNLYTRFIPKVKMNSKEHCKKSSESKLKVLRFSAENNKDRP